MKLQRTRKRQSSTFTWTFAEKEFSVRVCKESGALYFSDKDGNCFHVLLEDFFAEALKRQPKDQPTESGEPIRLTQYARRLLAVA